MAALFGWRKSPADIVKLATRSMAGTDDKVRTAWFDSKNWKLRISSNTLYFAHLQARDEVVKRVAEMKNYVCGEVGRDCTCSGARLLAFHGGVSCRPNPARPQS